MLEVEGGREVFGVANFRQNGHELNITKRMCTMKLALMRMLSSHPLGTREGYDDHSS